MAACHGLPPARLPPAVSLLVSGRSHPYPRFYYEVTGRRLRCPTCFVHIGSPTGNEASSFVGRSLTRPRVDLHVALWNQPHVFCNGNLTLNCDNNAIVIYDSIHHSVTWRIPGSLGLEEKYQVSEG